ncbi:gp53-like domain-containing protein [Desulfovibrio aminophilus]|uniref:gp53-like domain-containing protein n=1 Tax=Desulfovibrio aminophilus TaxID=81425 RepID=UPI0004269C89|nr:hypothetical protein [Desulfovibrio aminophilus]
MNRIDHSTATADKKFTEGSPAAAVPATVVTAAWLNVVQEELVKAVLAGGLSLSPTNDGQLGSIITSLLGSLALKAPLASPVFSGNPTAPTPPQFDNDTSVSTTAFVQMALGNLRGLIGYTTSQVLTVADLGKLVVVGGTEVITMTLPQIATIRIGGGYHFYNDSQKNVIIACSGTDKFAWPSAAGGVTQITLCPGETLSIVGAGGGSTWYYSGGSALLQMPTGPMRYSLGGSGYQRLPSGLIIQWGNVAVEAGEEQPFTLPVAFPTQFSVATATQGWPAGGFGSYAGADIGRPSLSQIRLRHNGPNIRNICYIAIGF